MAKKTKKPHIGSSFDDYLEETGQLVEVTLEAQKRVLAWQLAEEMKKQNLSKAEMARRMHTSRSCINRLLDPENSSVTLVTMYKAAESLGKHLELKLT